MDRQTLDFIPRPQKRNFTTAYYATHYILKALYLQIWKRLYKWCVHKCTYIFGQLMACAENTLLYTGVFILANLTLIHAHYVFSVLILHVQCACSGHRSPHTKTILGHSDSKVLHTLSPSLPPSAKPQAIRLIHIGYGCSNQLALRHNTNECYILLSPLLDRVQQCTCMPGTEAQKHRRAQHLVATLWSHAKNHTITHTHTHNIHVHTHTYIRTYTHMYYRPTPIYVHTLLYMNRLGIHTYTPLLYYTHTILGMAASPVLRTARLNG